MSVDFGFIPNLTVNGYGGPYTYTDGTIATRGRIAINTVPTNGWDILAHPSTHAVGRSSIYKTMVHELCHVFGIVNGVSTYDRYVSNGHFSGPTALMVNHGRPVRLQMGDNFHLAAGNGIIDVASWSGDRTFMSELELAILLDAGVIQVNLRNHFGYSEYRDGQNLLINSTFIANHGGSGNVLFDSNAMLGVGLHVVGEYDYIRTPSTNRVF